MLTRQTPGETERLRHRASCIANCNFQALKAPSRPSGLRHLFQLAFNFALNFARVSVLTAVLRLSDILRNCTRSTRSLEITVPWPQDTFTSRRKFRFVFRLAFRQ